MQIPLDILHSKQYKQPQKNKFMKISVTMLSSYMYCSRKLFLEKVLKLVEPPKESLVMGTVRHRTYEITNQYEEEIVSGIEPNSDFLKILSRYQLFYNDAVCSAIEENKDSLKSVNILPQQLYSSIIPKIMNEAKLRAENVFRFIISSKVYGRELWEKLTPKIKSEIKLESESLQLVGIIDQLHVYESRLIPFELKTGKMPKEGVWPGHRIQIAAYALLLEEHINQPVKEGFVRYLDSNSERQILINPMMKDEVKKITSEVIRLIESKELPGFCDNKNKCISCGLRQTCYDDIKMNELMNREF